FRDQTSYEQFRTSGAMVAFCRRNSLYAGSRILQYKKDQIQSCDLPFICFNRKFLSFYFHLFLRTSRLRDNTVTIVTLYNFKPDYICTVKNFIEWNSPRS